MLISLTGGPLDGLLSEGMSHLPLYMIAMNHDEHPIYKRECCCDCSDNHGAIPYSFVGYEKTSQISAIRRLS